MQNSQIGHAVAAGWSLALLPEGLGRIVRERSLVRGWNMYSNRHECDKRQSNHFRSFSRWRQGPRGRLFRGVQKGWLSIFSFFFLEKILHRHRWAWYKAPQSCRRKFSFFSGTREGPRESIRILLPGRRTGYLFFEAIYLDLSEKKNIFRKIKIG